MPLRWSRSDGPDTASDHPVPTPGWQKVSRSWGARENRRSAGDIVYFHVRARHSALRLLGRIPFLLADRLTIRMLVDSFYSWWASRTIVRWWEPPRMGPYLRGSWLLPFCWPSR